LNPSLWYNYHIMAVLYQKYRPQKFADVIGQEPIVRTLLNASKAAGLAHAYLFTGSRGVGKTTVARLLAKAANCQNLKDGDPCGKCDVCTAIANGSSLDIIEIDAASHTGVDNVREFIEHAQFRPTQMTRKVFIIDEVHMLSKAAFNALLKTLEEPPAHVMFILATTDIEKVPDTIVSRTQRFDFKRIVPAEMVAALEEILKSQKLKLPKGVVEAVVAQSEGSMRDALSRLDMVASLGNKSTLEDAQALLGVASLASVQELVNLITNHQASGLPDFFDTTLAGGTDPAVFNRSVLQYLRALLNAKLTNNQTDEFKGNTVFAEQTQSLALPQLLFIIRLFLRSYKELSSAPSPELPLLLASVEASLHGSLGQEASVTAPARQPQAQPKVSSQNTAPEQSNVQEAVVQETAVETNPEISTSSEEIIEALIDLEEQTAELGEVDSTVTLEDLQVWWPDVISRIKVENSPIATLLKNSPVTQVENGRITIAVKYLFHKEHLDNKKHAAMISEIVRQVSGKNLGIKAVINKNVREPTLVTTVDALSDALKVFGGELIE
jgi:DNA polymerase III subunit gamma/tau